jgi:hypothetical protein
MSSSTPTPIVSSVDEKQERLGDQDLKAEANISAAPNDRRDSGSEDGKSPIQGDDALNLVGTHAHQFDEKYYRRLRRKIVSALSIHCNCIEY